LTRIIPLALLAAVAAEPVAAAEIVASRRSVSATANVFGYPFDDAGSDADGASTTNSGVVFDEAVTAVASSFASSTSAGGSQYSEINGLGDIFANGTASAGLYVQGTGDAVGDSTFRLDFRLTQAGNAAFAGVIGVDTADSRDRPGTAFAQVRIVNLTTNQTVFNRRVNVGQANKLFDDDVALPAGTYRLTIRAHAEDATDGVEEVAGSYVEAFYDIYASITEN
jgi:hypothetical protein